MEKTGKSGKSGLAIRDEKDAKDTFFPTVTKLVKTRKQGVKDKNNRNGEFTSKTSLPLKALDTKRQHAKQLVRGD